MRRLTVGLFALCFGFLIRAQTPENQSAPQVNQPPATMIKMVVRLIGPQVRPRSFAAIPKTIYRAGRHYARIEDAPDARQGVQKVTIIAEPDAYSVNLIDKKGTHAIDQGGPNDLHLPVVLPFDPKHRLTNLDRLEFGDEYDFFQDAGAVKEAGPIINAKPTDSYMLKTAEGKATLIVKSGTQIPIKLAWQTKEGTYTYEYISYDELPFDASLFTKPAGITYKEIRPDTSSEPS
ncbi:MAG: hypothetical protein JO097_21130 [Acidobacteriaceae bacterium]|nr:hypothetical protein [Acidobacteriaceae bacterium]